MANGKRIYFGNIPYEATEDDIKDFFGDRNVTSVKIINDRETGRPRGFAFVEFADADDVRSAVADLDQTEMRVGDRSRRVVVREALEKSENKKGGGTRQRDRDEKRRGSQRRRDDNHGW